MKKTSSFFLSLLLSLGICSCFSSAEKVNLKSTTDNSVDSANIDLYNQSNAQNSYSNKPKYTVSFFSIVGTSEFCTATRTVTEGERVSPPEDFERGGYVFKGWYLEREYINLFDFNDAIYSDISIYARWEGDFVFSQNQDETYTLIGYTNDANVTEITVPSTYSGRSVVAIGNNAFNSNLTIQRVIIPESVTRIGSRAFYNCQNLQNIRLPSKITKIGADAFAYCNNLTNLYYSNTIYNWAKITFEETSILGNSTSGYVFCNTNLENFYTLTYDPAVLAKDTPISYNFTKVTTLNFSSNVTYSSISDYCYYGLKQLTSISINSESFTTIGRYSFARCPNLVSLYITGQAANKELKEGAFFCDYNLETLTNTDQIYKLGDYCFYNCQKISLFVFYTFITKIPAYAFYNTGLTSILFTVAYRLDFISSYAFASCSSLTYVGLKSVSIIESHAFYQCNNISNFDFGGTQSDFQSKRNNGYYGQGNDNLYNKISYTPAQ